MPCRIVLVAGARPNFMKVAPILRALDRHPKLVQHSLVHTGQHYDDAMSAIFFRQLGIRPPDTDLGVGSGSHGEQTGRILQEFERYLSPLQHAVSGVVVVGDVNSTLACALAAAKMCIPVAHVEAGLRSFDRTMPEEINRILTDRIADLLFVSDPSGERNLRDEGMEPGRIRYVGNVMIDTLVRELPTARALKFPVTLKLSPRAYAVVTMHRPATVDSERSLTAAVRGLLEIAERIPVVFPMHPRTRNRLAELGLIESLQEHSCIQLMDPLGYHQALSLLAESRLVLTDSGGIQEEASFLGIPCLTLRPHTERPVTVSVGTNTVVGGDWQRIHALLDEILNGRYKKGEKIRGWEGHAAERIVKILLEEWGSSPES